MKMVGTLKQRIISHSLKVVMRYLPSIKIGEVHRKDIPKYLSRLYTFQNVTRKRAMLKDICDPTDSSYRTT